MKNQIHLPSHSEARHRGGVWPVLLLVGCWAELPWLAHPARAAVTEAWVHRYNNKWVSNSDDRVYKVVRDGAGDIIVAGSTDDGLFGPDMLTIKYSGADGSVVWQKRYNGPANSSDEATAVAVDGRGNVVVTGYSRNASNADYYTAKYAASDGALLWEKRGPVGGSQAIAVDLSGSVMVTGSSLNASGNADYYTAKYAAADGTLLWEQHYHSPANGSASAQAVAVDSSGNVVVTGESWNTNRSAYYTAKYAAANGALLWEMSGSENGGARGMAVDGSGNVVVAGYYHGRDMDAGSRDYYTAKYAAATGALLWEKRYNGSNGYGVAWAVAVDGRGDVFVTGYSRNRNYSYDYYTAKYAASDGALLWERRHSASTNSHDYAWALAVDGGGNVVVTGMSESIIDANGNAPYDYYTAKYAAADGALLWEKRYNGPANSDDVAQAVVVDGSGNVIVTGNSGDAIDVHRNIRNDYYTAKYAAEDGALLWEKRYIGAATSYDQAQAVAVDGSGNIAVTGYSHNETGHTDYYTAKYSAANGALLWEKRYHGLTNRDDRANAVAVDVSGNVLVTGSSWRHGQFSLDFNTGYYTAKYAAADGTLLWEKRYDGPLEVYDDWAQALAVDAGGNVVVTGSSASGYSDSIGLIYDYYTAKYSAADGALLWEKRYHGPANGSAYAQAAAVDSGGNVVVTRYSGNGSDNADYYTAKYAAADGALLWERRYNGPTNSDDMASAVAVDGSDNVVVTGYSSNASNPDYYTAKYAAADGALLWEQRYNGPANSEDRATAVAVDGSGNVVVTGSSYNGSNTDYYTAKYAAADGALLWDQRGPSGGSQAIAVEGSGNVVVTGSSLNTSGNADYYTAKYAVADGALLWEQRYNGPANGNDGVLTSRSLALGPNGMIAITGSSGGDYATVVYRETLPPLAIERVPTGLRLRFTGVPGSSYAIERAPAVTGPWTTINTQTAPASGLFEYLDTTPPAGAAFYRAVQP